MITLGNRFRDNSCLGVFFFIRDLRSLKMKALFITSSDKIRKSIIEEKESCYLFNQKAQNSNRFYIEY